MSTYMCPCRQSVPIGVEHLSESEWPKRPDFLLNRDHAVLLSDSQWLADELEII